MVLSELITRCNTVWLGWRFLSLLLFNLLLQETLEHLIIIIVLPTIFSFGLLITHISFLLQVQLCLVWNHLFLNARYFETAEIVFRSLLPLKTFLFLFEVFELLFSVKKSFKLLFINLICDTLSVVCLLVIKKFLCSELEDLIQGLRFFRVLLCIWWMSHHGVKHQFVLCNFNDPLLDWVLWNEAIYHYIVLLANSMGPVKCLNIIMRVEVRVKDDYGVCRGQIDSQSACFGA